MREEISGKKNGNGHIPGPKNVVLFLDKDLLDVETLD
jgi:hypothetical protein